MKKIIWGGFLLLTFIVSLPATWWLMSKADFFYSPLYDAIGIAEHIDQYAPKNMHARMDFEKTSKAVRVELFHGIVEAINNHGNGLNELSYRDSHKQNQPLLTPAEVVHLQDVANLLDKLKPVMIGLILLWGLLVVFLSYKQIMLPSAKTLFASAAIILLMLASILLIGPEKVFNQLHVWVFPDNHQWFFYYEESLMSTMMKAPDLFAYIAAIWGVLSIFASVILLWLIKNISRGPVIKLN